MKKVVLKLVALAVILLSSIWLCAQQDPQFSQYMFNPLSINPGYAGSRGVLNGALVYRNQWVSFPGAPKTQVLAINAPMSKGKVGLGFEMIRDQIGPKTSVGGYFSYSYRIPLGKGKLAFGLGAGILNYRMNWDIITYKDAADPYDQLTSDSQMLPDFKFGMYFNNKKFYTGISFTHLNRAQYGYSLGNDGAVAKLHPHGFFTIGRAFEMNSNFTFSPSIISRYVVGSLIASVDLNLNFRYKEAFWFGASFRSEKSVIVLAQYSINEKFKVGYSYDVPFGKLRNYHSGSHEIMLGYDLNLFQSEIQSPRFF